MEKVLLSAKHDYWYFQEEYGRLNFTLLICSGFLNGVSSFDSITDQAGNPHVIAEKDGDPKYYFWNGVSWNAGPHPESSFLSPLHLAVLDDNQVMLIAHQKKVDTQTAFQLFLHERYWHYQKIAVLPDGAVIIAIKSLAPKGLFVVYTYGDRIKEYLGLALYAQGNWQVISCLPIEGEILNWFYEQENFYFLLGKTHEAKNVLNLLCIPLDKEKAITQKSAAKVAGWDSNPGVFSGQKGQLKLCWTYLGKISLADFDSEKLMFVNQRESEVFYPAQILTGIAVEGRKPSSVVVLKKIHGIKLDIPVILPMDSLEIMLHTAKKGLFYKFKLTRSSRP